MLPIDPGDGPGSVTPTQPLHDTVPPQATPHGGMIIRPGAVAWGGMRESTNRSASCEAIERALAAAAANPAELPGLLTELAATRLWVPLPAMRRPFTDGSAVRLPLVSHQGTDFVPCFTSVLRLTAWAAQADAPEQRAGDARAESPAVVPHLVVPATGLAGRLPAGVGLAINPGGTPGMPLYPECVPHLAALAVNGRADPLVVDAWTECNVRRLYTSS
ncbi:MAG TPA: SseB family protein [Trebonia sp.]|nr:SseB family protein [Trebonia sp.]